MHQLFLKSSGISTDTRKIYPDCMFVALKGENFNGNSFSLNALEQGAKFAVIDEDVPSDDIRLIRVPDALRALQDLSTFHRHKFSIPFIAITGSNGKTTTKELMRDVLLKSFKVSATLGNLNNHIGVPLTLLAIPKDCEIAIIEMGANHVGEIAALSQIADPDIGMITNIGTAHIGEFGGQVNIRKGKTELFRFLQKKKGLVFVPSDSEWLLEDSNGLERRTYGRSEQADIQVRLRATDPTLSFEWRGHEVITHLTGAYNLQNIAAAISIGLHFGVSEADICEALSSYVPENNRSQLVQRGDHRIIMDAYNANPSSMKAALDNFKSMHAEKHFFILGGMKELGEDALFFHEEIMDLALTTSPYGVFIGQEFMDARGDRKAAVFPDAETARPYLEQQDFSGSLILMKGSRGIRLEQLLDLL
ncbi:MAG: UDP-N-acetylmuramoyl-tripeptide--D-alanyl-D-alanine ligase [Bacteroidetes bacterium]|nr:UDP-N-acetylmuramoyl-tripeptide--D-alanyl-D-alanine ligase [Bacteroidota bacterium]